MKIYGHRGARGLAPENTLEGINAALAAHVDGIELDARATSDGVLVLGHDPYVVDPNDGEWKLSQHSYDFLVKRHGPIPRLEEAIALVPSSCLLRIEIKPGEPVVPFVALLKSLLTSPTAPQLAVVSFDYKLLREFHRQLPSMPLVLNEKWSSMRARFRAKRLGTKDIQMNQRWLWRGFLKAVKHGGYRITPYTVNSLAQAERWAPYIDGIITDYPDRFTHS